MLTNEIMSVFIASIDHFDLVLCQSGCEGPGTGAGSDWRGEQTRAGGGGGDRGPEPGPGHSGLRQTREHAPGEDMLDINMATRVTMKALSPSV